MSSATALPNRRAAAGRFVRTVFLAVLATLLPIGIGPASPALAALKPSVFASPARSVLTTPLLATPTLSVAWSAPSAIATFGTGVVFRQPVQAGGMKPGQRSCSTIPTQPGRWWSRSTVTSQAPSRPS